MSEWLKTLTEKYGQMNKKKEKEAEALDPVDKSELKGKHADRKDKDIDNDGDVDSSDKYLHKKRKAISKASDKDSEVEMNPKTENAGKKLKEMRKSMKEAKAAGATATHKGEQDPQDKGLSPSAKKEKARTTPMPDYVDEPKVDAKNFTDFRKGLKASPKRPGDSNVGDK